MNHVQLVGRLTKNPEIKLTSNQKKYCNFTLAVDRRFKDSNGQKQADFINCIAWNQTAEFIQKYFQKGNRIGVEGSIQVRSYDDNDGKKQFVTEVIINEAEFVESQAKTNNEPETEFVESQAKTNNEPETEPATEMPFEI